MEPISRRAALKRIFAAIAATGASSFLTFDDLVAADRTERQAAAGGDDPRLNLIWLHGTSCSGCSVSLLNIEYVPVVDILTKFTNMIFHHDVSLATGDQVTDIFRRLKGSGLPYVLVFEGAVPTAMPHACMLGHRMITEWVDELAEGAEACVAAGTCAAFAGVTRMNGMETGSMALDEYLAHRGIERPVINLPGCPMKPEHLVYSVLHYAHEGGPPRLDDRGRPMRFFSHTIHDRCIYYSDFQENYFAEYIGDDGCLLKLGCQGVVTRNDCLINGHNSNTNSCIRAGHPCIGCAGEHFPRRIMLHTYDDNRPVVRQFQQRSQRQTRGGSGGGGGQ